MSADPIARDTYSRENADGMYRPDQTSIPDIGSPVFVATTSAACPTCGTDDDCFKCHSDHRGCCDANDRKRIFDDEHLHHGCCRCGFELSTPSRNSDADRRAGGMADRLILRIEVAVQYSPKPNEPQRARIIWQGETGGPIRNPNFHEGRMLTQLVPAFSESLDKFKTMLQLQGDPFGWLEAQRDPVASYPDAHEATDPATEVIVARVAALIVSPTDLRRGRWDGENEADFHQRLFGCSFANCPLCRPITDQADGSDGYEHAEVGPHQIQRDFDDSCDWHHHDDPNCGLCPRAEVA